MTERPAPWEEGLIEAFGEGHPKEGLLSSPARKVGEHHGCAELGELNVKGTVYICLRARGQAVDLRSFKCFIQNQRDVKFTTGNLGIVAVNI